MSINRSPVFTDTQGECVSIVHKIFIPVIVIAAFVVTKPVAAASCPAGYDGPDASGTCTSSTLFSCELSYNNQEEQVYATIAENNLVVAVDEDESTQSGLFGSATRDGVTFSITSPDYESCYVTAATQATTSVDPAESQPEQTTAIPTVLPSTSADLTALKVVAIISAATVTTLLLAYGAKHATR